MEVEVYCSNCGKELVEGANFCTSCGSRSAAAERMAAIGEKAPEETGGVSAALASGRSRSRLRMTPLILLILALALTAGIAAAAYYVYTEVYLPSVRVDSEVATLSGGDSVMEAGDDGGQSGVAVSSFNGWWRSVGSSQSVFHHIVDDAEFIYQIPAEAMAGRPMSEWDDYAFLGSYAVVSVGYYDEGEVPVATEPCGAITFDGDGTFIMLASDENVLIRQNLDGSGYSVSGSLRRMVDVPSKLSDLASQVESSNSTESDSKENGSTRSSSPENASDYHFASELYEFDLPEYWRDRVVVVQNGSESTVYAKAAYEAGYNLELAWIDVLDEAESNAGGDIYAARIFRQEVRDGRYVVARAITPSLAIWSLLYSGIELDAAIEQLPVSAPIELFADYIDLSSGGRLGIDDLIASNRDAIIQYGVYAQDALTPLIRA